MFSASAGEVVLEGRDSDHPNVLEGESKKDFISLLQVILYIPNVRLLLILTYTQMPDNTHGSLIDGSRLPNPVRYP